MPGTISVIGFDNSPGTELMTPALTTIGQPLSGMGRLAVRTLAEEIARTLRGRAANPRWIQGMMRHGYRGAAELAATAPALELL